LSTRQAAARKAAVRRRLKALRAGPYGDAKFMAKSSVYCA
jgi:hypothetical protein